MDREGAQEVLAWAAESRERRLERDIEKLCQEQDAYSSS